MLYFLGTLVLLYVFSRITGMMDWLKEPGTKGWLLGMAVMTVLAFIGTALWLKSEFDDSDKIDKIANKIDDPKTGIGAINAKLDVLMDWYKREVAREKSFDDWYAEATPEDQQKIWKAKPLFDIEYARLLKKHGNPDAVKKELPALKQKLLHLDVEKKLPDSSEKNGSHKNREEIEPPIKKDSQFDKLPLPPK